MGKKGDVENKQDVEEVMDSTPWHVMSVEEVIKEVR
jgi:hypothetical protein